MLMPLLSVVSLLIIYLILTPSLCHYIIAIIIISIVILTLLISHVMT